MADQQTAECPEDGTQPVKIKGIFSSTKTVTIGAGSTKRKEESTTYWVAVEVDDGMIRLQSLDINLIPHGQVVLLPKDKLFHKFHLEPEMWYKLVQQRAVQGDRYRQNNQFFEAQAEYSKVTGIDEDNIRANFGLGLVYLARNEAEKARYALDKIVALKEAFQPQHKHLFNEFGLALRKKRLYDLTLRFYFRAAELCGDDEHLFFNIARAYYEKGDLPEMFAYLRRTLEINPGLAEARKFVGYLSGKGCCPRDEKDREFFRSLAAPADPDPSPAQGEQKRPA